MKLSINDIFQMEHSNNKLNLIALKDLDNNEYNKIINDLNLDINNFYKVQGKFNPYCYSKDTIYVEIYEMSKEHFINFHIKERIMQQHKLHQECLENNDYNKLFLLIDKPFRFSFYQRLFNQIPNEQKYEIFRDIYTSSEYGFQNLSREFLCEVFKYNKVDKKWFDTSIVTIYRGEASKSMPYNKAYSWTTDIEVARWFAKRFNSNGKVYKGKIKQSDILDFINDRNEKEVLAFPKDVFDIELI